MWKSWFIDHPLTPLALIAMALFVGTFAVAVWRAWRAAPAALDERARLPLSADSSNDLADTGALHHVR
jgi:hypothetical protein